MEQDNRTVVGVFDNHTKAERVVQELVAEGIPRSAVRIDSTGGWTAERTEAPPKESGGFFDWLFGPEEEEERGRYAEAVHGGSTIVSVSASPPLLERAADIMNAHGPVDLDRDTAAGRAPSGVASQETAIPIIEEELQVGKRAIRRGGVRIYSRTTERPVEEQVHLKEERVHVERRPADRPLEPADAARLKDQSIEMHETVEEPVVSKRARVKEEVVVGKETAERTERISDTVRHTDVDVEPVGTGASWAQYGEDFRRDYESRYGTSGARWETMEPAYQYGYRMAGDRRYQGKSWSDVEPELRMAYLRDRPGSTWDSIKDAVRYGWEKMAGRG